MNPLAVSLAKAAQHHHAGELDKAEAICRKLLARDPGNPDVLHLLGLLALQRGLHQAAADYIGRAIARNPLASCYHINLGNALQELGRTADSVRCYQQALQLDPASAEAHNNLGNALARLDQPEEAVAHLLEALRLQPDFAAAYSNLGNVLRAQGRLEEAVACYQEALRRNPASPEAHNNLGAVRYKQGRLEEALALFRKAVELKADYPDAHYNLANAMRDLGQPEAAAASYRRALALRPAYPEALNNLGCLLKEQGLLSEAARCHQEAMRLRPDYPDAPNNLGNDLYLQGRLAEALACYRQALALKPSFAVAHSNVLFVQHYAAETDPAELFAEHQQWAARHAAPLAASIRPLPNDRSLERPLRIGYVSPDFRAHPVGYFLEPILEAQDPGQFQTFCYAEVVRPDRMTERFKTLAYAWRAISGLSDQQVAERVRADRIDILVDLAGHTGNNRLLVFARKPAPVAVSYLGYPNTTGLPAIDYRITDQWADPPGLTEHLHVEQLVRMPDGFLCFRPPEDAPPVSPPPVRASGRITFGCFNNLAKVTPQLIALWASILRRVPNARLILKSKPLGDPETRARFQALFEQQGLPAERIELLGVTPSLGGHLELYNQIDITLDTFPYNGTMTTCEALWMGAPVVALAGQTHVSRVCVSLLAGLGLTELLADSPEQYVKIALELAADPNRLERLRADLRERMRQAPLTDARRFTRSFEQACRRMWRRWCGSEEQ